MATAPGVSIAGTWVDWTRLLADCEAHIAAAAAAASAAAGAQESSSSAATAAGGDGSSSRALLDLLQALPTSHLSSSHLGLQQQQQQQQQQQDTPAAIAQPGASGVDPASGTPPDAVLLVQEWLQDYLHRHGPQQLGLAPVQLAADVVRAAAFQHTFGYIAGVTQHGPLWALQQWRQQQQRQLQDGAHAR
jgi:hypothetical protein